MPAAFGRRRLPFSKEQIRVHQWPNSTCPLKDHTKTKVKSPQTNGICERFHKTVLQEVLSGGLR